MGRDDSQSSLAGSMTLNTPLSHGTEQGAFKKPKKNILQNTWLGLSYLY